MNYIDQFCAVEGFQRAKNLLARALHVTPEEQNVSPLEKLERAFQFLDSVMFMDPVVRSDPVFQQIHRDLREARDGLCGRKGASK